MNRQPRQVGLKTIFDLFKQNRIHLSLGLIFTLIPFAIGGIFFLVLSMIGSDVPEVDYVQVNKNGRTTSATITDIQTQENVTIGNDHPSIISYTFTDGDKIVDSQYKILAPNITEKMKVGDTIQVKYLADSSIITGIKPFKFPIDMITNLLIPFLVIGLILLTLLYLRVKGKIQLYKNGEVKDAEIVSMTPRGGSPFSSGGQGVTVHYQYKTTRGEIILGESFTSDYTILNSKKQGDLVKIFVSVDNESKSTLISKLDEIRNNWKIE